MDNMLELLIAVVMDFVSARFALVVPAAVANVETWMRTFKASTNQLPCIWKLGMACRHRADRGCYAVCLLDRKACRPRAMS